MVYGFRRTKRQGREREERVDYKERTPNTVNHYNLASKRPDLLVNCTREEVFLKGQTS